MARAEAPKIIQKLNAFNQYASTELLGGPKIIKLAWVINLQKGGTIVFVYLLMRLFDNNSAGAWAYLGLHGSYGLIWLLKHFVFPDPNWEKRVTFGGALAAWGMVLGPYWVAPVLLITGILGPEYHGPTSAQIGICMVVYAVGVVMMMASDAQKYFTLRVKRGLIQDGMFKHIRHPNYLGEMMIYGSFAGLVGHWIPWAILAFVWTQLFMVNILMKEASMSRYPEWAAYKARTGMLLPKLFGAKVGAPEASEASV